MIAAGAFGVNPAILLPLLKVICFLDADGGATFFLKVADIEAKKGAEALERAANPFQCKGVRLYLRSQLRGQHRRAKVEARSLV